MLSGRLFAATWQHRWSLINRIISLIRNNLIVSFLVIFPVFLTYMICFCQLIHIFIYGIFCSSVSLCNAPEWIPFFKLDTFIISLSGRFFNFAIVRTGEKASKSKTQWHNHHQSRNPCHKPSDRIRLTLLCIMTVLLSYCSCMISICIHIFS